MKTLSKIVSEKGNMIGKFIIYQIAMSFFGLMMFMSVSAIAEDFMLLAGIFCIAFYASILGTALWDEGVNDKIKISGGRMKKDNFLGLKICLIPYSVTMLITAFNAVYSYIVGETDAVVSIITAVVKVLLSGVYVCFDLALFPVAEGEAAVASENALRFFLYCFVTLVIGFVAYWMGVNGIGEKKAKK